MRKLLCFLGFHKWEYVLSEDDCCPGVECEYCNKTKTPQ